MKVFRFRLLVPLLALTSPTESVFGQAEPSSSRVRAAIQRFVDEKTISGAVAVVGDDRGIVSIEAVGLRDIQANLPMRPDTLFRIASMTKPITAVAIMILVDEGKLKLDDPVETSIPAFHGQMKLGFRQGDTYIAARPARPITLRDLLTHTSGLPDAPLPDSPERDAKPSRTLAESSENYARRRLSFEPGSRWSYSNAGINTLGRVIEVASGVSYEDFLQNRIFDPLGMIDTTFYPSSDQMNRLALTYALDGGELQLVGSSKVAPKQGERPPSPAGGLYSTGPDLAKLDRMLLGRGTLEGHRIITEAAFTEMTRLQTGEIKCGFVDGMGYGLGVGFVKTPTGVTEFLATGSFGHGGAYETQNWIDPKKGKFAILLIQRIGLPDNDGSPMRRELQRAVFDGKDGPDR